MTKALPKSLSGKLYGFPGAPARRSHPPQSRQDEREEPAGPATRDFAAFTD